MIEFYLGAHRASWLERCHMPICISRRVLEERKTLPEAVCDWLLDSGGFSELSLHGKWVLTPQQYVALVRRFMNEIGRLRFAAQQDWMCEPHMIERTGLNVEEHQKRTIDNYLELMNLAPDIPWMPVIQGWTMGDYDQHIEDWYRRGVELDRLPRVGVGSVCRREDPVRTAVLLSSIAREGIRVHGFGLKARVLGLLADSRQPDEMIASADSMAWSYHARKVHRARYSRNDPEDPKTGEQNDLLAAIEWLQTVILPKLR